MSGKNISNKNILGDIESVTKMLTETLIQLHNGQVDNRTALTEAAMGKTLIDAYNLPIRVALLQARDDCPLSLLPHKSLEMTTLPDKSLVEAEDFQIISRKMLGKIK